MSKHEAVLATAVWFPWQRVWRTTLQVIAGLIITLSIAAAAIALWAPTILHELQTILPPGMYAWLLGAIAICGIISGALAKLMAIPGVNAWLSKWTPFGSAPKAELPKLIEAASAGVPDISSLPAPPALDTPPIVD